MVGNGCASTVRVTELLVRAPLANFGESEFRQNRYDLPGLQNRKLGHSGNRYGLGPDKLGIQFGFAILQQHPDHFAEIRS